MNLQQTLYFFTADRPERFIDCIFFFVCSKSHRTRDVTLSLAYLRSDLMTFSIYARDYSQDLTSQSPRLPMLSQWSLTIVVSLAVLLAHRHSHQA